MEIIILKFHHDYPKVMGKKGVLFCIIIGFEMIRMLDYIIAASIDNVI